MNIVLISTYSRPEIFQQSITSLITNAADWSKHHLTIVFNGNGPWDHMPTIFLDSTIFLGGVGASRSRNVGASSIPRYLRHNHICFFDDDVYTCAKWDEKLEKTLNDMRGLIASGHSHPFNKSTGIFGKCEGVKYERTNVLSTVNIACSWGIWDNVGPFCEPGGPGGSEDVEWCKRASQRRYELVVIEPQCVIHTGITNSRGTPIVGTDQVMERNKELERLYGLEGKVVYA